MKRYGIIDLGSNTIRLVIYDVRAHIGDRFKKNDFESVLDEKVTAGLSAYVEDGVFTDAGIAKACAVLEKHVQSAKNIDCSRISLFGTAVIRNCSNSGEVVRKIEKGAGLKLDLLSGEEEARLGFVGASIGTEMDDGVLVDIGGGSTELTLVRDGRDRGNLSVPMGSVSSYAGFIEMILPTSDEMAAIRDAFSMRLDETLVASTMSGFLSTHRLFGIGGSVRAIAKMHGRMLGGETVEKALRAQDVVDVLDLLVTSPSDFAHVAVKAVPDRLHTLVPGSIIVSALMERFGAEELAICKFGLREGYLKERVLRA